MRVIVTGTHGLIGSEVVKELSKKHEIIRAGRNPSNDVVLDISLPDRISQIELDPADALVHCAGVVDEDFKANPEAAFLHATAGTSALLKISLAAGVKRLIYISSAHVYGYLAGKLDETSPPNPLSDYAIAHYASEQIFRRFASIAGCSCVILRPCAAYGWPQDLKLFRRWSLIPFSFPLEAMRGKIVLRSYGEQRRNFISTSAIATYIQFALARDTMNTQVWNPVGSDNLSVYDFAFKVAALTEKIVGKSCLIERPNPPEKTQPSLNYTSRYLSPQRDDCLTSFLSKLIEYLHNN